ncbi:hypothetical protein HNQ91_002187 [Filimonas zeae]|uniref:Thiol-activated cytolysin n=1 Tax=Filimonas zeae TaxID=1737353 RepID=A0A917MUP3_9BACT|nr:thiol-activated cytolysin family protein [Filimonas zeae]MDR6339136.1 hypothetical protein [Filimonas zeae]GGH64943.1 hypothetical protein GCM10011379_17550 [Filimonas zeae]
MNNKITLGVALTLCSTMLLNSPLHAQKAPLAKSISRFQLIKRPAFNAYFERLAETSKKVSTSGGQTLATKTGSLGKSEVVVNMTPRATPVQTVGAVTTQRNGSSVCESQNYNMDYLNVGVFNSYTRALPASVYPGAFIEAQSLLTNRPSAYSATGRAPLNIGISINDSKNIKNFTATTFGSNYTNELHTALRNKSFGTQIPAYLVMNAVEVNSLTQLQANFDLTVGLMIPLEELGVPVEISQGISVGVSDTSSRRVYSYLLTYEQPMYDYTVKEIDRSLFFTAPGAAAQHPTAVMVRSVVYGRRITMLIKSSETLETVKTTVRERLGVSTTGDLGVSAGLQVDAEIRNRFEQQINSFHAFVQGGSAELGNKIFHDPAAIKSYIEDTRAASLSAATGEVPIQYILEKVNADAVVGVRSTANYNAQSCIQPHFDIAVIYKGIKCNKVVEAPGDDKEDVFGRCSVNGKRLADIPENSALSIKAGTTSADLKTVLAGDNITLDRLATYILTFTSELKDWELLQKPEFKLAQPLDGKYQITTGRLNKIMALDKGESTLLDEGTQELKLYENSDKSSASISVLYQVKVTRN